MFQVSNANVVLVVESAQVLDIDLTSLLLTWKPIAPLEKEKKQLMHLIFGNDCFQNPKVVQVRWTSAACLYLLV